MARKDGTMIYEKLYDIWNEKLDDFIYGDSVDLISTSIYGDFSHKRFLEVKENAKKFLLILISFLYLMN